MNKCWVDERSLETASSKTKSVAIACIVIFVIGFISCVVCIFFQNKYLKEIAENNSDSTISITVSGADVPTLVTFIGLTFAIAVATPYFISGSKIEAAVRNAFKRTIGPNILDKSDEIIMFDAHLSRMIAFYLIQHRYYYWAVGWSFRSLKHYAEVNEDNSKYYCEFYAFVFKKIIIKALEEVSKDTENMKFVAENVGKKEEMNIKIRAIKDYVDFCYVIDKKRDEYTVRQMYKNYADDIDKIKDRMKPIIVSLYEDEYVSRHSLKAIEEYIFEVSRYKSDKKGLRKFYYTCIFAHLDFSESKMLLNNIDFKNHLNDIHRKYHIK